MADAVKRLLGEEMRWADGGFDGSGIAKRSAAWEETPPSGPAALAIMT